MCKGDFCSVLFVNLSVFMPISLVQFSCSVVSDSVTPWTAARQASLSITNSWSLLKLMSIESVMPSNHLISVVPFHSPFLLSAIRVVSSAYLNSILCKMQGWMHLKLESRLLREISITSDMQMTTPLWQKVKKT